MKKILLVSHYSGTPGGPCDKFYNYLNKKYLVFNIKHPLFPFKQELKSEISNSQFKIHFKIPALVQFFGESLYTLVFGIKIWRNIDKFDLAICFDSLSFTHIYILKKILRIKKMVFYSIDFSQQRFSNKLLNLIYHQANNFAYQKCDYYFSLFDKFNHSYQRGRKNFLVKSTASNVRKQPVSKFPNSLVYAGSLEYGSNNFDPLLNALAKYKKQGYKFKFDIYGLVKPNSQLKLTVAKLKLNQFVFFKGIIDHHTLTEKILPRYYIGLAPYVIRPEKDTPDHTFSGTDLTAKIVDYIAAGLPVITTKINPGFKKIPKNNFGFLVHNPNGWYLAIKTLLFDKKIYQSMKKQAIKISKKYDIETVLTPILQQILP